MASQYRRKFLRNTVGSTKAFAARYAEANEETAVEFLAFSTDNPSSIAMLRRLGSLRLRLSYPGVYEAAVALPLRRDGEVRGVDKPRGDVGHGARVRSGHEGGR